MAPSSGYQNRLQLACEPSAPRYARAHAEDVLSRWCLPRSVVGDALLIVSELATNAVRHTGAQAVPHDPDGGRPQVRLCALSLLLVPDWLYISVYDEARNRPPVLRQASDDEEGGRGVVLVNGLTEGQWGWTPSPSSPGKFVWARLRFALADAQGFGQLPRSLEVSA